jgi:putative DNA primase/helicase
LVENATEARPVGHKGEVAELTEEMKTTGGAGLKIPETLEGWRFVKLRPRDKIPVEADWPSRTYAWDDPELLKWIEQGGNYGVVGDETHVIIDGDTPEVQEAVKKYLPKTFTVLTPGHPGEHYYFIFTTPLDKPLRLRDRDGRNVGDIQGRGKQVVGPGCIHPNGGVYEIIDDIPVAKIFRAELYEALAEFIIPEPETFEWEQQERGTDIPILDVLSTLAPHFLNGAYRQGVEFYGPHPIHGSETKRNFWVNPAKNVWFCFRCQRGGGSLSLIAVLLGLIKCDEARAGALRGSLYKQVLKAAEEKGIKIPKQFVRSDEREKDFIPLQVAQLIQSKFRFVTHRQSHIVWVYRDGVYSPDGEETIRAETRDQLGEDATDHRVNEVVSHIRDTTFTDPEKFAPPLELINLENGILNLKTRELSPHSPDIIFTNKMPVKYDPNVTCPRILKFLGEVTVPDDIPVIQEFVGYFLWREYIFAVAMMLLGEGENGKSTFLNLLIAWLGKENVATPSLQKLLTSRFALAELYGKLANIHADLPPTPLSQTGAFKMLTGRDTMHAEQKFHNPFNFVNYAKLIYSTNELPETKDLTEAFWRRWMVATFPNKFPEGDPRTDPHILEKLTTPEELSGLLNWALEGLERLLKDGKFSRSQTRAETEEDWTTRTDSLRAFADKYAVADRAYFVTKDDFYEMYQEFCEASDVAPVDKVVVGRRLPTIVPKVRAARSGGRGEQRRVWQGLKLIEPYNNRNQEEKQDIHGSHGSQDDDLSSIKTIRECVNSNNREKPSIPTTLATQPHKEPEKVEKFVDESALDEAVARLERSVKGSQTEEKEGDRDLPG